MSPKDELRQTLTALHHELDAVSTGDPEVRTLLLRTLGQIADRLEEQERVAAAVAPASTSLATVETVDLLRASARQFEVDHPTLATSLQSLVDALSRMGI